MKIARWGNSLAVRLPRSVVEALNLKEGDDVQIRASESATLEIEASRDRQREEALARIDQLSRPLPFGFKFDRDELYDTARNGFRPEE